MTVLKTHSHLIGGPHGQIFIKSWEPNIQTSSIPFLLFHDSLGCVDLWRTFPESLCSASGHPVIAYDRLGFGQSEGHAQSLTLDFIADEAQTTVPVLLKEMKISEFIACGHSVGGAMAVETAARFQECTALITIGAQAFVDKKVTDGVQQAKTAFADEKAITRLMKYHGDKTHWVIDAWTETWLHPAFMSWNLDKALQYVNCPVLALHGEFDEYASEEHPARIAASRGLVKILPRCGHMPHREAEAAVIEEIQLFLHS